MAEQQQSFLHNLLAAMVGGDPSGAYGDMPTLAPRPAAPVGPPDDDEPAFSMPDTSNTRALLAQLSQYLGPIFGQQMARAQGQAENPFLVFPNRGFFGRHPRITRGIEGALMGAALTRPSQTVGEGISNVAQAVLGMPEFEAGIRQQRALAPLQTAMPLMQLLGMQTQMDQAEFARQMKVADFYGDREYKQKLMAMYDSQIAASAQPRMAGQPFIDATGGVWDRDLRSGTWTRLTGPDGQPLQGVPRASGGPAGIKSWSERQAMRELLADQEQGVEWTQDKFTARVDYWKGREAAVTAGSGASARADANIRADVTTPETLQGRVRDARAAAQAALGDLRDYDDWYDVNRQPGEKYADARKRFNEERRLLQRALGRIESHLRAHPNATWDDVLKATREGVPSNAPKPGAQPPAAVKPTASGKKKPMTLEELEAELAKQP